jgi:hypothetical protein
MTNTRKSARSATWLALLGGAALAAGCHSTPSPATAENPVRVGDCREGPIEATARGADTAAEGAETGVETAASGIKQGVKAAGGFLADGTEGAEEGWNEQKEDTKAEAREGRAETSAAASPDPCP